MSSDTVEACSHKSSPVVVAAGGTGGHVVPALAVVQVLASKNIPVVWMGTRTGLESRMVPAHGIEIRWINVSGLRGKSLLSTMFAPVKLLRAIAQSVFVLISLKPRAVLGMGGFVSGPVGIAALILRKPLVLHEQNAVAGMTNRWLSPLASRVFSAFPDTFKASAKAYVVGNPVLQSMVEVMRPESSCSVDEHSALRVLVVGGSRGAKVLNDVVPQAIKLLERDIIIRHQAGAGESAAVLENYGDHSAEVIDFIDDMTQAYRCADIVICRAGAMTVTELSALAVPGILVPYPFAVDDHQSVNARHLSDNGAAIVIPQTEFTAENLSDQLLKLVDDPTLLGLMSKAAARCYIPNAAQNVAAGIIEVSA